MKTLSVVLPVRLSADRLDLLDRLSFFLMDSIIPESIEFVVVDDGSLHEHSILIQQKCKDLDIKYFRVNSELEHFSAGRARNFAAQNVTSKFIMFQDVDLMPYDGFYRDALNECYVQKLDKFADRFVMFGVIYLTKEASIEFVNTDQQFRKNQFINYLLEDNHAKIEKFSTGTSVTIWRRDHYLCTGGNDPDFEGWGYEDLEYACRAIRRNRKFALPDVFYKDHKNFMTVHEYKGWKSTYRLFGDLTFNKGMVLFHYWHPVDEKGSYIKQKVNNKKLFNQKLESFAKNGTEPNYLPSNSKGKSLLFRNNPWTLNRWVAPNLGEIVVVHEEYFNTEILLEFIQKNNINRVVFHNPYANEKMLDLYNFVRKNNIPFLVCERGALRDSVFLDENGFNADSTSYSPMLWDKEFVGDFREKTLDYIREEKSVSGSLEHQNSKISKKALRDNLKIPYGKKILFIPLQRPTDTVIKYFSGRIKSYDNFISLINSLAHVLPRDWEIIVKRHPLEVQDPDIKGVTFANNANIKSLIDMSDAVLLINSGVGVLSMIYGKPTLVAGDAFYSHDEITYSVKNVEDVVYALKHFRPHQEKTLKFLSYLINEFYSFGNFTTRIVDWEGGAKMTATTAINYYCVRFPKTDEMLLERSQVPVISKNSILFDRYRNPNGIIRQGDIVQDIPINSSVGVVEKTVTESRKLLSTDRVNHKLSINKINQEVSVLERKLNKFKNNPKLFLDDSQFMVLRLMGRFVK